jgi:hypothetical protein
MSDSVSIWKELRKKARTIFSKNNDQDCSKEQRRVVKKALSDKPVDLEKRIGRLRKALKMGHITKKQYRLAKKLIIASYE